MRTGRIVVCEKSMMSQSQKQKQNGSLERSGQQQPRPSNGHVAVRVIDWSSIQNGSDRLCISPKRDHKPDNYDDLQLEFNPHVFTSLEHYLPPHMLNLSRDVKLHYMRNILLRYLPENERIRIQKQREYRQRIMLNYPLLHKEIYSMDAENFFTPSFLRAIKENTEASFRSIMAEPCGGIYTFQMLQPQFCEKLIAEVDNFERWVHETKFRIMRPNIMNRYGVVLDDFGLESMLDRLVSDLIRPISRVFYTEIGGSSLDSHHGFVVEYGINRDVDLGRITDLPPKDFVMDGFVGKGLRGLHVDDSEVSLNICLGNEFSGGELFFRGVRCDEHVMSEIQPGEIFDCSHAPGHAILHSGRHRHGARPTTSGNRMNLVLWCRSSAFRELKKYQRDFPRWCGECRRKKEERERLSVMAIQRELLKREMQSAS